MVSCAVKQQVTVPGVQNVGEVVGKDIGMCKVGSRVGASVGKLEVGEVDGICVVGRKVVGANTGAFVPQRYGGVTTRRKAQYQERGVCNPWGCPKDLEATWAPHIAVVIFNPNAGPVYPTVAEDGPE